MLQQSSGHVNLCSLYEKQTSNWLLDANWTTAVFNLQQFFWIPVAFLYSTALDFSHHLQMNSDQGAAVEQKILKIELENVLFWLWLTMKNDERMKYKLYLIWMKCQVQNDVIKIDIETSSMDNFLSFCRCCNCRNQCCFNATQVLS